MEIQREYECVDRYGQPFEIGTKVAVNGYFGKVWRFTEKRVVVSVLFPSDDSERYTHVQLPFKPSNLTVIGDWYPKWIRTKI